MLMFAAKRFDTWLLHLYQRVPANSQFGRSFAQDDLDGGRFNGPTAEQTIWHSDLRLAILVQVGETDLSKEEIAFDVQPGAIAVVADCPRLLPLAVGELVVVLCGEVDSLGPAGPGCGRRWTGLSAQYENMLAVAVGEAEGTDQASVDANLLASQVLGVNRHWRANIGPSIAGLRPEQDADAECKMNWPFPGWLHRVALLFFL
jgi:hypothetical protein